MLLYFCGSSIYAQVKDKLVTISFKNIPLSEAMARIEKESGYTFFYDVDYNCFAILKNEKIVK